MKHQSPLVFVIDDDQSTQLMMQATLEEAGFRVRLAGNCQEARRAFAEEQPDIMLLDVMLPDGDGFHLCREFLQNKQEGELPIAMVTGLDDLESIRLAYDSGAMDFITKPVSWGTLAYRLQYLLRASRALADLSLSESKTRILLSGIPDIIIRLHRDGRVLDIQAGSYVLDLDEWLSTSARDTDYLPAAVAQKLNSSIQAALEGQGTQVIEFSWSKNPSVVRHWEARLQQRESNEVLLVIREITQRKQLDNQLRLWSKVYESSGQAILILDAQFHILSANQAYQQMIGYSENEVLGVDTLRAGSKLESYSFYRQMVAELKQAGQWQGEITNQRKNGEIFPSWFSVTQVSDSLGVVENYIAIITDITEQKSSREKIEFLAHHDALTGLPNRLLLNDRLEMSISQAERQGDQLAVLFIDLDRFKQINDSLGHSVGDEILKEAAQRLQNNIRVGDTVSRLGGDEFVVLFPKLRDENTITDLTIKLRDILQLPYKVNDMTLHITPSIGIAIYPENGSDPSSLIKNADAAMYLAKEKGRNNYQFYTPALNARSLDRLQLETDLRDAITQGNFELHYQPQIIGKNKKLWGVEALVRWRHPQRGLVSPADFIPLAEETGLIIPLGEWVFTQGVKQLVQWRQQGLKELTLSVNISALQFRQVNFSARVKRIVDLAGINPAAIELEVTESLLMSDVETSIQTLKTLHNMGFRIAIDDFGTGFSSLNYLRRLPIHLLKIDQSFVREMSREPESLAIVEAIIALAKSLDKVTIAEGVETENEFQLLMARGCQLMQGYFFARPMPANDFERWYQQHTEGNSLDIEKLKDSRNH